MLQSILADTSSNVGIIHVNRFAFQVDGLGYLVQVTTGRGGADGYWSIRPVVDLVLSADLEQIIRDEKANGRCLLTNRFEHDPELTKTMTDFAGLIEMVIRTNDCCLVILTSAKKFDLFNIDTVPWILKAIRPSLTDNLVSKDTSEAPSSGSQFSKEPANELRRRLKRERFKTNEEKVEALQIRDELTNRFVSATDGRCRAMCSEKEALSRPPLRPFESCKMVKAYQRAAADQLISSINDLRPPDILWETVKYLLSLLLQDPGSCSLMAFISDRLHAVRKDIVQQVAFDCAYSRKCLEAAVRFYIYASVSIEESFEELGSDNFLLNDSQLRSTMSSLLQSSTCDNVMIAVYLLIGVSASNPYSSDDWAESAVHNLRSDNRHLRKAMQIRKHVISLNCPSFWLEYERTLALGGDHKLMAMMMLRIADGLCARSLRTLLLRQDAQASTGKQGSGSFADIELLMTMMNCDDEESLAIHLSRFKLYFNQSTGLLEVSEPYEDGLLRAYGRTPLLGKMFDSPGELVQFLLAVESSEALLDLSDEPSSFDQHGKYAGNIPEGDDSCIEAISDSNNAATLKVVAPIPMETKFQFKMPEAAFQFKPPVSNQSSGQFLAQPKSTFARAFDRPSVQLTTKPHPSETSKTAHIERLNQPIKRIDPRKQALATTLLPEIFESIADKFAKREVKTVFVKHKISTLLAQSIHLETTNNVICQVCENVMLDSRSISSRLHNLANHFQQHIRRPWLLKQIFERWNRTARDIEPKPLMPGDYPGSTADYCKDLENMLEKLNQFDHLIPQFCTCKIVLRLSWFPFTVSNQFSLNLKSSKTVHVWIVSGYDPVFVRKNPQHHLDTSACVYDPTYEHELPKVPLVCLDSDPCPSKLTDAICASILKCGRRLPFNPIELSVWSCLSFVRTLRCRNPSRLLARVLCENVLNSVRSIPPIPSTPEVCLYQNMGLFKRQLVLLLHDFDGSSVGYGDRKCGAGNITLRRLRLWGMVDEAHVWSTLEKNAEPLLMRLPAQVTLQLPIPEPSERKRSLEKTKDDSLNNALDETFAKLRAVVSLKEDLDKLCRKV